VLWNVELNINGCSHHLIQFKIESGKMNGQSAFNPADVKKYFGKNFLTESGSLYGITDDGRIRGRPSIEEAEVMLIAGIPPVFYWEVRSCLDTSDPELKDQLDDLIRRRGQEIKPGLHLVVSLKPEYVKQKDRYGIITLPVKEIQ